MKRNNSRTFLAIKNTVFNFVYQIINTITNIILPPIIIGTFGSAINGLISTVKQIINYIQLVGAGISESTIVSLYKPLNDKNDKKVNAIYNATGNTFNKSGLIFSVIALGISFIYPLVLKSELNYFFVVKLILILSLTGATEFFALGKYRSLLVADQKIYIVNSAQIVVTVLSTVVSFILIKLNFSIIFVQIVSALIYSSRIILLYLYIHKKYKFLDKKIQPDYDAISKRKSAMIHQFASLIIFGSQTLFISKYCGLKAASVYAVYNLVFTGINTVLSTISSAMVSGMGNLMVKEKNDKVNDVYNVYEYGYYICVFIFYIIAFIMCMPFIKLYTSGVNDVNYIRFELIPLFSIMGLLNCLRTPGATMINAKGHYDETKNRALIEMVICLIGEIILVNKFEIVGVLFATIFAYLYRTIDVIIYSNRRIMERSPLKTFKRIVLNSLVFAFMIYVFSYYNPKITSYFSWLYNTIFISFIILIIVFTINYIFDRKTFKSLKKYLLGILKQS